jgi:hypothetical protein
VHEQAARKDLIMQALGAHGANRTPGFLLHDQLVDMLATVLRSQCPDLADPISLANELFKAVNGKVLNLTGFHDRSVGHVQSALAGVLPILKSIAAQQQSFEGKPLTLISEIHFNAEFRFDSPQLADALKSCDYDYSIIVPDNVISESEARYFGRVGVNVVTNGFKPSALADRSPLVAQQAEEARAAQPVPHQVPPSETPPRPLPTRVAVAYPLPSLYQGGVTDPGPHAHAFLQAYDPPPVYQTVADPVLLVAVDGPVAVRSAAVPPVDPQVAARNEQDDGPVIDAVPPPGAAPPPDEAPPPYEPPQQVVAAMSALPVGVAQAGLPRPANAAAAQPLQPVLQAHRQVNSPQAADSAIRLGLRLSNRLKSGSDSAVIAALNDAINRKDALGDHFALVFREAIADNGHLMRLARCIMARGQLAPEARTAAIDALARICLSEPRPGERFSILLKSVLIDDKAWIQDKNAVVDVLKHHLGIAIEVEHAQGETLKLLKRAQSDLETRTDWTNRKVRLYGQSVVPSGFGWVEGRRMKKAALEAGLTGCIADPEHLMVWCTARQPILALHEFQVYPPNPHLPEGLFQYFIPEEHVDLPR